MSENMFKNKETRQKYLDNITKSNQLKIFSTENSSTHREYHHYTNIKSLTNILNSQTLWFSRADLMNDMTELELGDSNLWKRTYISSFSYGASENIALWYMYGGEEKNQGIRVSIKKNDYIKDPSSMKFKKVENDHLTDETVDVESIEFLDVAYLEIDSEKESLRFPDYNIIDIQNQLKVKSLINDKDITGFIKDRAWEFEKETRIRVIVDESVDNRDIERIYIDLDDEFLNNATLTLNPWNKEIDVIKNKFHNHIVNKSKFTDKIKDGNKLEDI